MRFIREFWGTHHILGNDKEFFIYEHGNDDKTINFIIAVDRTTNEIRCIQGFIPYSGTENIRHICGVMSKTHPNNRVPLLGVETMSRMFQILRPTTYCGIGTNPETMLPLAKLFFKRHVGVMCHYYMLNLRCKDFKIAVPGLSARHIEVRHKNKEVITFELVKSFSDFVDHKSRIKISDNLPFKGAQYIRRRYFENPIYKYKLYKVFNGKKEPLSLIVTREVNYNSSRILHWVDYFGLISQINKCREVFFGLMRQEQYEYIDCLSEGIDESTFDEIGFTRKEHDGDTIIPSYFSPFIQKNIKIHFEKSDSSLVLFGGDSDADRPNKVIQNK